MIKKDILIAIAFGVAFGVTVTIMFKLFNLN